MTQPAPPPVDLVLRELAGATDRLLATVDTMSDADFANPSVLPGWSRADVLAHLALNAKGLAGVLTTVAGPAPLPLYASDARRDADIEHLAGEPPTRIAERVAVGSAVLAGHLGGGPSPDQALEMVGRAGSPATDVEPTGAEHLGVFADTAPPSSPTLPTGRFERTPGGRAMDAADIPVMRWREVEIHHADLGLGYGPDDWPDAFTDYLLGILARDRGPEIGVTLRRGSGTDDATVGEDIVIGDGIVVVEGSRAAFAWWLLGRGRGAGLRCAGRETQLPDIGPWVRRP